MSTPADPFGIRSAADFVLAQARDVSISDRAAEDVARRVADIPDTGVPAGAWQATHLGERELDPEALANYVLVLDALNFSFWGHPRWRVPAGGNVLDGYWALKAALGRALDEGYPITDASYLTTIPALDVARILRGESVIPMFAARVQNLREAGRALAETWDGSFLTCARSADGSAIALLRQVITSFPSFVDVATYRSHAIPFYKRAQILVSDLAAAFAGADEIEFRDLEVFTAFADYKVPQVLQHLGVLRYSDRLQSLLTQQRPVPAGSELEVEIRAGTIAAVERIAWLLRESGVPVPAYQIDWFLWDLGQDRSITALPYHRTRTAAY